MRNLRDSYHYLKLPFIERKPFFIRAIEFLLWKFKDIISHYLTWRGWRIEKKMFLSLLLKIRIYPFLEDASLSSSAAFQTTPLYSSAPGLFTRKSNHSTFWSKSREQWHNKRPERVKKRIQSQEFFHYLPSLNRILLSLYVQNPGGSKRNLKCSPH